MKVAIVHEWLVSYAGAELVLTQIIDCFPEADLFSVIDFLPKNQRHLIRDKKVNTTFIQKIPFAKKKYRAMIALMPLAIEQLDLSEYDIIISSSHAVAKGIITGANQLHISYVHTPMRYAWDLQHQYLREANLVKGPKALLAKWILHKLRAWDVRSASSVDYFFSNSNYVGRRIAKFYRRSSKTLYPGIYLDEYNSTDNKDDFYVTASRMVPYKRIDLIVSAFAKMLDKQLIVIGEGPDWKKIKKLATPNVSLLGYKNNKDLKDYLMRAKAFVFAAEEDFGILPVESQACGTPVIFYGKGGCLETVIALPCELGIDAEKISQLKPTGVSFERQNVDSLIKAVKYFEANHDKFLPAFCIENAKQFSHDNFKNTLTQFVKQKWEDFSEN